MLALSPLRLLALCLGLATTLGTCSVAAQIADDEDAGDDGYYDEDLLEAEDDDGGGDDDDYDVEEEDEDDLWEEEDALLEEEWEAQPNITADELDVLSGVADYLSSVHHLLGDAARDKERRRAEGVLDDAFGPVKRDAVAAAAASALLPGSGPHVTRCVQDEEARARELLTRMQVELESCYELASPSLDPPSWSEGGAAGDGAEESGDAEEDEEVRREAEEFLSLALAVMRAVPLIGAPEVAELAGTAPHGATFQHHAEMLARRARRRRGRVQRCVDLRLEDAYARADAAREALAACLLLLGHPPPDTDPHDEL
ncbi:hypothetical protein R5R35_007633 [Gryllus longicercus]|uniref:Uncharacterized protein n=1 Tax=Gryllus longicercus TaxID=2509291 RepID=A0AAN9VL73_9ORTH